ncbi:MAG: hypothetical protein JRD47_08080 [Deltaproteobacteria bacterium]|nr:hypothetical protein [Deltaproteobacteria bacterium]
MTRTTRLNALEVAIANEMRKRKFYLKHAERTTDPLGAAMFRQIADDELQHYEKLKQLQEGQESKEGLPETLPLEVLDINLKEILKETIFKKKNTQLDQYSHLKHYNEWLPMNIEGVYERLMEESGMSWRPDID